MVAVGLGTCVYLWSAATSRVTKLVDLRGTNDSICSVSWSNRGTYLAVGTNSGDVQIWDPSRAKKIRSMPGHLARVGCLDWGSHILSTGARAMSFGIFCVLGVRAAPESSALIPIPAAVRPMPSVPPFLPIIGSAALTSPRAPLPPFLPPTPLPSQHIRRRAGSRDRTILQRDVRCAEPFLSKLVGHRSEVCGLRWSPDRYQLASGGNDNQLLVSEGLFWGVRV